MDTQIVLRSGELELVFLPDQGGKWRSLRDRKHNREWLWENPHLPTMPVRYGASYIETMDTGGWDEIFPSVSPCTLDGGIVIPDHGALVGVPWAVVEQSETRLVMAVEGDTFPFRFTRTIELSGTKIHCSYRLENLGETSFPWLWCAHPLFPVEPGMTLEADPTARFGVVKGIGSAKTLEGRTVTLSDLPDWALSDGFESPWAAKLFSESTCVDQVTLRQADGSGLRFCWDAKTLPHLGLWINCGAWSGCGSAEYFNLGIEPSTLPVDDLTEVDNPPSLAPGEASEWTLCIEWVEAGETK